MNYFIRFFKYKENIKLKNMRILLLSIFIPIAGLKILKFFIQFYILLTPSLRNKLASIYLSPSTPHPYDYY